MTVLLRIAERVLNRPLLVHPDKVPLILAVLHGRIPLADLGEWRAEAEARIAGLPEQPRQAMQGPAPQASRFVGTSPRESGKPYAVTSDGVGIITITGSLINRGAWVGAYSGQTSYEGIKHQLAAATADPAVKALLLDLHSPGGEATGAFETADAVRQAAREKPVTAVVNGMAASAAYALASGARSVVTTPTGVLGSIGVVLLHADFSRALDKEGITPTLIFAGAHKVDANPFEPLTDGVREDLQREVAAYYDLFVQTVAAGRRGLSPAAIRATEARTFLGEAAVAAGLADSVGSFETALADLSRGSGRLVSTPATGAMMDQTEGAPAATTAGNATTAAPAQPQSITSVAALAAAYPELSAALRKEGADAERARILGIEAAALAGHEKLVADMKADGTTTPDQAAGRILRAEQEKRGQRLQDVKNVEAEGAKVPASTSSAPAAGATAATAATPEAWTAEWQGSEKLRAEYPNAESYVATMRRKARLSGR